jgi:hypothetical protein
LGDLLPPTQQLVLVALRGKGLRLLAQTCPLDGFSMEAWMREVSK